MFRFFVSASAAALLLSTAGAVFASDTDMTGTVKSVDLSSRHITLANGERFSVDEQVPLGGFMPGDHVVVNWVRTGDTMQAVSVSPAGGLGVNGVVKSTDIAAKTLTLENGQTFHLADGVSVGGLNPRDRVTVTWDKVGAMVEARSVSPLRQRDIMGTVKTVDVTAKTIALEDGTTYTVAEGVPLMGYKSGDHVTIIWDQVGGERQALDLMPSDEMSGNG